MRDNIVKAIYENTDNWSCPNSGKCEVPYGIMLT